MTTNIMKNNITALLLLLLCGLSAAAQERRYYGFSPLEVSFNDITAIGTSRNNFIEAAICLDTECDPLLNKLRESGATIVGVRFYVMNDYKQRAQSRSLIEVRQGEHSSEPVAKKVDNFLQGWNEVMFDTPVAIAEGKNYVGYQVYETIGTSHPIGCFAPASVPNACWINAARDGFVSYSDRGTLLIQAIIEGANQLDNLKNAAVVSFSGVPTMMVQPSRPFDCTLFVRNLSSAPISTVEFEGVDNSGKVTTYNVTLENAVPAYEGRTLPYKLIAPSKEGVKEPLTLHVTRINGETAEETVRSTGYLYVALDAYDRVPLVEEFTSQYCVNCPFMAYFLDRALEEYKESGKPYIYVAHHSGFREDRFTTQPDRELTYMFEGDSFNPAVMYDRRTLTGTSTPIQSAKVAETEPYMTAVTEAGMYPALAEVNIEPILAEDGKVGVHVSGSVNRYFLENYPNVYLSCYLIQNGIPVTSTYFQEGLDDSDAPADLKDTYRHNGVIRAYYNKDPLGDKLEISAGEHYTYDKVYEPRTLKSGIDLKDCDLVAFVHLVDKKFINQNYVLNAGSARLQGRTLGINSHDMNQSFNAASYDLMGRKLSSTMDKSRGIYVKGGKLVIKY